MLNGLKPIEGGPDIMLVEGGLKGPKKQAAITKYQKKSLGWADGRIDVAGPTIKKLVNYIVDSPTVPYGKLGAPANSAPGAGSEPGGSGARRRQPWARTASRSRIFACASWTRASTLCAGN